MRPQPVRQGARAKSRCRKAGHADFGLQQHPRIAGAEDALGERETGSTGLDEANLDIECIVQSRRREKIQQHPANREHHVFRFAQRLLRNA